MTLAIDNRGGPAHRHAEGDNLWYKHPITEERFLSVTSALDYIESSGLSLYWRPGLAAQAAFDMLPRLVAAQFVPRCGRTYRRCDHDRRETCPGCPCGDCRDCLTLWMRNRHFAESGRRATEGSVMHAWIRQGVLAGTWDGPVEHHLPHGLGADAQRELAQAVRPYTASFRQFAADYGITAESFEMCEATILNRQDGWGGTLDAQIRFDATATPAALKLCRKFGLAKPLLTTDWKSREGGYTGDDDAAKTRSAFFPNNAKQLAAYRRGEVILFDDGREEPLPATDGAVAVQLRPDGYTVRPVVTDEVTYGAFLANLASARWEIEHGARATQVKSFPDLEIPDLPAKPTARKAAPRKATAAKTTPAPTAAPAAANGAAPKTTAGARAAAADTKPVRALAERLGVARSGSAFGNTLTDSDIPF